MRGDKWFYRTKCGSLFLFSAMLIVTGLALAIGGAWLVAVGGSFYYLLAGIGLVGSGLLYARRWPSGFTVFAAIYIGTIIWAFWEVGPQFWPLVPRLVAPTVLALFACLMAPLLAFSTKLNVRTWSRWCAASLATGLIAAGFAATIPHGKISNAAVSPVRPIAETGGDWSQYGRTGAGNRFVPFDQINSKNVDQLKVAWTFRTGDPAVDGSVDENTPLQIGDTLFTCSPHNIVHALDVDTGVKRWTFDPKASSPLWQRCRGLGYYQSASSLSPIGSVCAQRIVMNTIDARLIELDAVTGKPCSGFGTGGSVDLKKGMGEVKPGYYFLTAAPTVTHGLIVVGGFVFDNREVDEPSGVIRAFSAETGKLVWAWDMGNPKLTREPPSEGYTRGTPNMWSAPAFDEKLGLIYIPTGNATPDFWGGRRTAAADRYSSSIVALELATGRERWRFQTVHHDLWDLDIASQPALYDIPDGKGGTAAALIQLTKRGQIFVLDRRTGKPLSQVIERSAPQGAAAGDRLSPTQPYSIGMPAIGNALLTEASMWGVTPFDQLYCRIQFRRMRYKGEFTPPGLTPAIMFPGEYGGMNWGSGTIDATRDYLIVNDIRVAQRFQLLPRAIVDRDKSNAMHLGVAPQAGTPFGVKIENFMSPLEVPCQQPPYGTMTAIDLKTKRIAWQVPLGTIQDTGPLGIKTHLPIPIGMPTIGGPVSTKGGVVFYAGTQDYYLRALDAATGNELWKGRLPVGADATPMSYISPKSGRQYVVISAGGSRDSPDQGDYVIAYALPRKN